MLVKLTKEGRKAYYGTQECYRAVEASLADEYLEIRGEELVAAGACKKLILLGCVYLFEDNEYEVLV